MLASLLVSPTPAAARWHGGWGWALPAAAVAITIAGLTYYTYNGVYYRPGPQGYVVVPPPGPVVYSTPPPVVYAPPAPPPMASSVPSQGSVVVISSTLNLRSGPGYNYAVVAVVQQGSNLAVMSSTGAWLSVQTEDGQVGWVAAKFTRPAVAEAPAG